MSDNIGDIMQLLHQWRQGTPGAENQLFDLVVSDFRRLVHHFMRGEHPNHTLQPTEPRQPDLCTPGGGKSTKIWRNQRHFFAIAVRAMHRYLSDRARGRPDVEFVALDGIQEFLPAQSAKLQLAVAVNGLLNQLAESKPEWCDLVEAKYFLGLTDEEAADVLGVKLRTMQQMWRHAPQWPFEQLESSRGK